MASDFQPHEYLGKHVEFENGHHGWVAKYDKENHAFICKTWKKETFSFTPTDTNTAMNRYNDNRASIPVSTLNKMAELEFNDEKNDAVVKQCELQWMQQRRSLVFDKQQIITDLGTDEANRLFSAIDEFKQKYTKQHNADIFGALAWNGVVSRWQQFMQFLNDKHAICTNNAFKSSTNECKNNDDNDDFPIKNALDALHQFGVELGRITSYRALALTEPEFESIRFLNEIVPTGRLRASAKEMQDIVEQHGVTKITVARLYISHLSQWIGLDPSLSLHDDKETALCIAQTYMSKERAVYLFEMDVPKIMATGFKVVDVQNKAGLVDARFAEKKQAKHAKQSNRWFGHNGVWFDAYDERTERQLLYTIPFFKQRCKNISVFKARDELLQTVEPFKQKQQKLKDQSTQQN